MDVAPAALCAHCRLPVGRLGQRRELQGDAHWFCCYGCCLAYQVQRGADDEPQAAAALIRLGVGGFLTMFIMLFSLLEYSGELRGEDAWLRTPVHVLLWLLATPLVGVLGGPFFAGAWQALRRGRLSTDALVSLGVLAAYGYSAWQVMHGGAHVYFDTASMVLGLFTLGRCIEAQGRVRAARSLAPMLAADRAEVRILEGGVERTSHVHAVQPGDLLRVMPGERVVVDGLVVEGSSNCDESALTGQAEPQLKQPGSPVHAGSLNGHGALLVRASVPGTQTRWIRICAQVREALAAKSLAGELVERAVALFIPTVLLLATGSAVYWGSRQGADSALLAGLAVLVVACPCSLGLAAPFAHALAIAKAAQRGVLVRGGGVLERLAQVRGVAFDKTGTLTGSALHVVRLDIDATTHAEALRRATALARWSDHPASRAIAELGRGIDDARADAVESRPGEGLWGRVDGAPCAVGSSAYMRSLGWEVPTALDGAAPPCGTRVCIGWDARVRAIAIVAAQPRPEAASVVAALHRRGLHTLLLSGDVAASVEPMARSLSLGDWRAGLMPGQKVDALQAWRAEHGRIAMVGDGLNDGPVLAAASVGIAVGDASDLARESADVVLPPTGLDALPWLFEQADGVRRSVRANIAWAFGYNTVALTLAVCGLLQPVIAAALMAGSSVVVVLRSWRASRRIDAAELLPLAPRALPRGA